MELNTEFEQFGCNMEEDCGLEVSEVRHNDNKTTNWYFI
jgi:hypothetical protein